jgi:MoxR-like ATPase
LRHRVLLKPEAELEGLTSDQVISEILATIEVPK